MNDSLSSMIGREKTITIGDKSYTFVPLTVSILASVEDFIRERKKVDRNAQLKLVIEVAKEAGIPNDELREMIKEYSEPPKVNMGDIGEELNSPKAARFLLCELLKTENVLTNDEKTKIIDSIPLDKALEIVQDMLFIEPDNDKATEEKNE